MSSRKKADWHMRTPGRPDRAPALLLDHPAPHRIAVFRALQLGDLLVAVPALRALRAQFPKAEITLIGLPWAKSFVQRFNHYVDRFVEFAGYPGIVEMDVVPERTACFIEEQRSYGYDLVIQMHGSGESSNSFVLALGGKLTVGYYKGDFVGECDSEANRQTCPCHGSESGGLIRGAPCGYPARLTLGAPYPDDQPEVLRNLGLVKLLGCTSEDPRLEFPLFNRDCTEAAALLRRLPRADRPWIGLHAGARPPARRWPAEYFAALADDFAQRFGAQIILTGGPGEEETVQAVVERMKTQPVCLVSETSLGGLAALISELDLFVSNDTGPAHIANAVDTPSITIFGPADYRRWAPLDQVHHPIVRKPVACSPCGYWECPIDHRCLRGVTPHMVMEVAEQLLTRGAIICDV